MPPKGKRAAAPQRDEAKIPQKRTRGQKTAETENETITLSLDEQQDSLSGNAIHPPMVEHIFDIDTILKDQSSSEPASNSNENISFGLSIGDERPPDMIKCSGDDLSAHIPHQLKVKIWSHKYFNIALLLKGTAELNEMFSGGVLHISSEGKVEAKPRQSKEVVPNIERWTDAFLIFASIYVIRYPTKVQEILKYMSIIRDAASKFSPTSWRSYDEQFRMRQENQVARWDHINSDLWLSIMPSPVYKNPFNQPYGSSTNNSTCRYFNKGSCTFYQCSFRHACDLCGSTYHGMVNCTSGKPFRGFRTRFYRGNRRGSSTRGRLSQGGHRF